MSKKDTEALLKTARDRFHQAHEAESENREAALDDVKFENGEQWDEETKRSREADGRPCLVINKTAGTVKQIVGSIRQNRPRIKVRPVDDTSDPQVAEVLTGLIRNIENISDAEAAYDNGVECAIRGGYGYWRVLTQYADDHAFDQDIIIKRIVNPQSVYFDQSAVEQDYSDARFAFVAETMSKEAFEAKYPKATLVDFEKGRGEDQDGWFSEDTVRVAEYFWKESTTKTIYLLSDGKTVDELPGQKIDLADASLVVDETGNPIAQIVKERSVKCDRVMWAKISGSEVLEGPKEWPGKHIPIVPCLGEEIWIEGKRHLRSAIRFAKDPAKLYNWARSTAVETMAMAPKQPWLVTPEMIEGHEYQWDNANASPQPYLLYNQTGEGKPDRNVASIPDSGALQEAVQASDDIKATTGIFDASLGAQGNETSGRAIMARQKQGDTATFIFTDNHARALKHTGRILVDLIPKIYDTERVVRLLNEEGAEGWARINQQDPISGKKINDLSVGRYDVVVDVGPGYTTKRLEAADGMIQLLQAAPQFAPVIIPRIAKNLDWPESDAIGQEMQQMMQPQPNPKAEIELEGKQLDNARKQQQLQQGQQQDDQRIYQIAQQAMMDMLQGRQF